MKSKAKKRFIWIGIVVVLIVVVAVIVSTQGKKEQTGPPTVKVEKQTIIDKALAVGAIEPRNEIAVKSKISGVVGRLFVHVGDFVQKGEPVLEIKPDPTPLELADAKRNVEMADIELNTVKRELDRNKELIDKKFISDHDYDLLKQNFDQAELRQKIAMERLELIQSGKIRIAETIFETTIKAPITGYILEKTVDVGDPVVPLTSYQAGTELMKMANMDDLIFKGTVDEIDVGKISEEMFVELQVGALPGKSITGEVSLISLKAQKQDNSTVFPVEIMITETDNAVLLAGFSANAHIIIARMDSVLSLPERVVYFRNDSAFVHVSDACEAGFKEKVITTGLSDAIQIEIESGLEEGEEILEKEVKEII